MQIFIKIQNNKLIVLEVNPYEAIEKLKMKIKDKKGFCIRNQRLSHNIQTLSNERTLADYNIQTGATLYLELRSVCLNSIYIVNGNKRILKLNSDYFCYCCNTFLDLKSKIQTNFGLKTEYQELSYNEKILDDSKRLLELVPVKDVEIQLNIINPSYTDS